MHRIIFVVLWVVGALFGGHFIGWLEGVSSVSEACQSQYQFHETTEPSVGGIFGFKTITVSKSKECPTHTVVGLPVTWVKSASRITDNPFGAIAVASIPGLIFAFVVSKRLRR